MAAPAGGAVHRRRHWLRHHPGLRPRVLLRRQPGSLLLFHGRRRSPPEQAPRIRAGKGQLGRVRLQVAPGAVATARRRVQRRFVPVGGGDGGRAFVVKFAEDWVRRPGIAGKQHQSHELHVASERAEAGDARIGAWIITTRPTWDSESSPLLRSILSSHRPGQRRRRRRSLAPAGATRGRSKAAISHSK